MLELRAGASLVCAERNGKAAVGGWLIGIDPLQLIVIAGGIGASSTVAFTLWSPAPPAKVRSTIEWTNSSGFIASLTATPGRELLGLSGTAGAFLDRPLAVDGGALPISGNGSLFLLVTASATDLAILAVPPTPPTDRFTLALENALVGVHAPRLFLVIGSLADPKATQFTNAKMSILSEALWLLPTLPDPYAADFEPGSLIDRPAIGLLGTSLAWAGGSAHVGLTLALITGRSPWLDDFRGASDLANLGGQSAVAS